MSGTLFQNGRKDAFFTTPPVSFEEIRGWIKEGGGEDGIGLGAVVEVDENDKVKRIAGELVMPGGKEAYMMGKDGVPHLITPEDEKRYKVTFAQVGHMAPEQTIELDVNSPDDLKEKLQQKINELFPEGKRDTYMIRVDGNFSDMTLRGVDTQDRDVAALKEIPQLVTGDNAQENKAQTPAEYRLIGVFSKKDTVENGVTFDDVLHLHGIDNSRDTKDHKHGGHVTGFGASHVKVEIMPIAKWLLATREKALEGQEKPTIKWVDKIRISAPASPADILTPTQIPTRMGPEATAR
jgi:alpha-acetolactate decarboxylase